MPWGTLIQLIYKYILSATRGTPGEGNALFKLQALVCILKFLGKRQGPYFLLRKLISKLFE